MAPSLLPRRALVPVLVPVLCLGLVLGAATSASAADLVDPATGGVVQGLESDAVVSVAAGSEPQFVTVPVADGVVPTRVIASLAPLEPLTGTLSVVVSGRVVQTLDAASATAIDAPVQASDVVDGVLAVGFQLGGSGDSAGALCEVGSEVLSVSGLGVVVDGTPTAPTTVGDFFPDAVTGVSIVVPDGADDALRAAGLSAAASLASRYSSGTAITVSEESATEGRPALDAAQGRIVRFAAGDGDVVSAIGDAGGVPELTLTGAEADLAAAGAALGSEYAGLASSATTTGLAQKVVPSSSLEHTLADFGTERIALGSTGASTSYTTITQSAFGGPVSSVEVDLVGTHSAVPEGITATANVYWNDFLIGSTVLGQDTDVAMTLPVPTGQLSASNGLSVTLSAVRESDGACIGSADSVPIEFFVDGAGSSVTGVRGESAAPGFGRFPQAFGGELAVAFGGSASGADALRSAGDLVTALQRVDADPLAVSVVGVDDFLESDRSGVVVGAGTDEAEALRTPLRLASFTAIDASRLSYGVGTEAPYAALEAFTTDGREIVLLGGWSADGDATASSGLQSSIAGWAAEEGWTSLSGNLAVSGSAEADPVLIDSNEITPQDEVKDDYSSYAIWFVIAVVVIGLLILLGWLARRRRSRKVAAYVDAQERAAGEPAAVDPDSAVDSAPAPASASAVEGDHPAARHSSTD
ncbi:hypothetical protein EDF54_2991 [Rathayibacter sp. PhB93]|uniref:hypothetical protein n=1 Tax=unclassified Rathayibacter TaxID=2609250 RepID=UPI000F466171|nr:MULTISPECIES: hypothetical protein [unclassified Rathayibacter]ROQ03519.1 hypothetical protein EDF54_2991 [Rathayibacter sp. PhB93]TDQ10543.1 hypothetical protein EDF17_2779 [Rathayibacter sp. PhB1]